MNRPDVAVVIPVHNNGRDFEQCLDAVLACDPAPREIVVVDDGSGDGSGAYAAAKGVHVIRLDPSHGPAHARNSGVEASEAEGVLFVDADVVVPSDTVGRVADFLSAETSFCAIFGSYDDSPLAPGILSKYRNLLHHWVHQHSKQEASTFWTGCGAVRRAAFESVGGFDPSFCQIEDVEFGLRLKAAGYRIRLDKSLLCTHLKRWTAWRTVRTDVFGRAIPWSRLAKLRGLPRDLNFRWQDRLSALLVCLLPLVLAGALIHTPLVPGLIALLVLLAGLNGAFYRFLLRKLGVGALLCIPWHWFYLGYSAVVFGAVRMLPGKWVLIRKTESN